jgi:hypothetical protein
MPRKADPPNLDPPSLGLLVSDWIEEHAVIPDGFHADEPFRLTFEQLVFVVAHYEVRSTATLGQLAPAFRYRRSMLVRPQKWGKSPLVAAIICAEAVGPVVFAGWAGPGDEYVCSEHGCPCGWVREYLPGDPMGMPWPTPLIQITATSEEQTDNTYAALRPMIENGRLSRVIRKTGEAFIRLPGGGRIDTVTASATSRLGQRITFASQDETGIWTATNGMVKVAETQRRGLAGMGGRAIETTNGWDPAENSVAQRTSEAMLDDVLVDHRLAPPQLSYRNKVERKRIHRHVYGDSGWVDLDAIEAEAFELLKVDPAQAERFFGNRLVAGSDAWLDEPGAWDALAEPQEIPVDARIVFGFDGSQYDDWTAIRARVINPDGLPYAFTPRFPDGKAMVWNPVEHGGEVPRGEVQAGIEHLFDAFDVVRGYFDPELWQSEIDAWVARFGQDRVVTWPTYRTRQMAAALERWKTDVLNGALRHDGDPVVSTHIRNARRVRRPGGYVIGKPTQHQKIDAAVADTLAHEALGDVIAAGLAVRKRARVAGF